MFTNGLIVGPSRIALDQSGKTESEPPRSGRSEAGLIGFVARSLIGIIRLDRAAASRKDHRAELPQPKERGPPCPREAVARANLQVGSSFA